MLTIEAKGSLLSFEINKQYGPLKDTDNTTVHLDNKVVITEQVSFC